MRKFLVAALLLLAPAAFADEVVGPVIGNLNLDVTNTAAYTYCVAGDPVLIQGGATAAASTNVTVLSTALLTAGDIIYFRTGADVVQRKVSSVTNATTFVTTGAAVTYTNATLYARKVTCGTGATNGVIPVDKLSGGVVMLQVTTVNSTSIDFVVELRVAGVWYAPSAYTKSLTAAGNWLFDITEISHGVDAIRIGVKETADASTQDVSYYFQGKRSE